MPDDFKWEEPPARLTGRAAAAAKLAKRIAGRPNTWARIAIYDKYLSAHKRASAIRCGTVDAFKEIGKFEAEVREIPEGYGVWVKCTYVKKSARKEVER